jgi:hypothetical protein
MRIFPLSELFCVCFFTADGNRYKYEYHHATTTGQFESVYRINPGYPEMGDLLTDSTGDSVHLSTAVVGSLTVRFWDTADPDSIGFRVIHLNSSAPSFLLDGQQTGTNNVTVLDSFDFHSVGKLSRSTGEGYYELGTMLTNDLYPNGLVSIGAGVVYYDFADSSFVVEGGSSFLPQSAVPTLAEWGVIVLASVMMVTGVWIFLRRIRHRRVRV